MEARCTPIRMQVPNIVSCLICQVHMALDDLALNTAYAAAYHLLESRSFGLFEALCGSK